MKYDHVNSQNDGIVLAHQAYGEPVTSQALAPSFGENVERVTQTIMEPPGKYPTFAEKAKKEADRKKMAALREKSKAAIAAKKAAREAANRQAAEAWTEGDYDALDEIRGDV